MIYHLNKGSLWALHGCNHVRVAILGMKHNIQLRKYLKRINVRIYNQKKYKAINRGGYNSITHENPTNYLNDDKFDILVKIGNTLMNKNRLNLGKYNEDFLAHNILNHSNKEFKCCIAEARVIITLPRYITFMFLTRFVSMKGLIPVFPEIYRILYYHNRNLFIEYVKNNTLEHVGVTMLHGHLCNIEWEQLCKEIPKLKSCTTLNNFFVNSAHYNIYDSFQIF